MYYDAMERLDIMTQWKGRNYDPPENFKKTKF